MAITVIRYIFPAVSPFTFQNRLSPPLALFLLCTYSPGSCTYHSVASSNNVNCVAGSVVTALRDLDVRRGATAFRDVATIHCCKLPLVGSAQRRILTIPSVRGGPTDSDATWRCQCGHNSAATGKSVTCLYRPPLNLLSDDMSFLLYVL